MPPTKAADSGTAQQTPENNANKPIQVFNEIDIARALKLRFPGREIDTTEPIQVATEQPEEKAEGSQEPETNPDTPPDDKAEEVLSESEEESTQEEASTEEVDAEQNVSEEEADARRYSERTKARIERLAREKAEAKRLADEAAAKVSELESKLVELQNAPQVEAPKSHGSFSDVWDENKLNDEWQKARQLKRWCEDNQDGATLGDAEYTAQQVREIKRSVEDALEVHIPQRFQFLKTFKALRPEIEKVYPWVKDKNSQEYAESLRLKAMLPQLTLLPEHDVLIGDFLVGRKMRLEAQKKASSPQVKAAPKPAPKQPGLPKQVPARVDTKAADAKAAEQRFFRSQGEQDLAKLLKAKGFA